MRAIDYSLYPNIRHSWRVVIAGKFVMYMTATYDQIADAVAAVQMAVDWEYGILELL